MLSTGMPEGFENEVLLSAVKLSLEMSMRQLVLTSLYPNQNFGYLTHIKEISEAGIRLLNVCYFYE